MKEPNLPPPQPSSLARAFRKTRFALFGEPLFQFKREEGTAERMSLILKNLTGDEKSAIDLGANAGLVARAMAERGMLATGFDLNPDAVKQASKLHAGIPGLSFALLKITPDSVEKLPVVDVIFCLSVFHYWVFEFGEAEAWRMVKALQERCRLFFFEPASAHYKYRQLGLKLPVKAPAPDFKDLDPESIKAWIEKNLRRSAPGRSIRLLGSIPCIADDRFRLLYVTEKKRQGSRNRRTSA